MKEIKPKTLVYANLAVSILTGVLAQIFMKLGMNGLKGHIGITAAGSSSLLNLFLKIIKVLFIIFTNKFVALGIILYLLSMFFWINVLSKIDLSVAYPFVSLGIVLTVILAAVALHEPIPILRWAGIFITISGVYLIVSSHKT